MRGEEFLLQGEQNCGHLSSLSGRAIALGSEPPFGSSDSANWPECKAAPR